MRIFLVFLHLVLCSTLGASETNIVGSLSPTLRTLCLKNRTALTVLTDAISGAFSSKSVGVFYFYSDSDAKAPAFHFYPQAAGMPDVVICVAENQSACDQFLCILYEATNSRKQTRFFELAEQAKSGTISRTNFAREIMRAEFEAVKTVRDQLVKMKLERRQTSGSRQYKRFANCPSEFDAFLSYTKAIWQKVSPDYDPLKEYGDQYDALRMEPGRN